MERDYLFEHVSGTDDEDDLLRWEVDEPKRGKIKRGCIVHDNYIG